MAQKQVDPVASKRLRREAEKRAAAGGAASEPFGAADAQRLVHELQVHQIELEMQNEELRRTQVELEEHRNRYQALYDQAPVGYLTLDRRGTILEANLTAASMLSVEARFLPGLSLASFVDAKRAAAFELHLRAVLGRPEKQGCDLWIRKRDGGAFPAHIDSVADLDSCDPGGAPTRCRTVILDLTDLRQAQDDLRTQESRTRTLLDTLADAVISTDANGRIESLNAAAERLFGYKEAEIQGQNVGVLMPAPSRNQPGGLIGAASREALGVRKDGSICPIEISAGEWWDHGQRKLTAIVRDISARKQAERALQESEARFRQIAENIDDAFNLREPSGAVSYASPAYERIWGRPAAELVGKETAWLETIDPQDRARVARTWQRLRAGEPLSEVYRIWRPDGTARWVNSRAFPVAAPDGTVLRYVGVVRDITTEHRLEAELLQSQKMEAVGTLASGVAHNLRNMLQAILAFIFTAQRQGSSSDHGHRALERAVETAKKGAALTDQMMVFTHKREAAPEPVGIDAIVHDSVTLLRPLVGESITLAIEGHAPRAWIVADPVEIEQLLLNLAANARDAMPAGGTLTIATEEITLDDEEARRQRLLRRGRYVQLTVRDTGVGMDEATRTRIFEPFFTTKAVGKGTGLGLFTVFALTKRLGGSIGVTSDAGHGTTFTLLIPCCEDDAANRRPSP